MGDQGRWFKLWVTAPYDIHLSNLSLENFARWCLFGVYLKTHGTNGTLEISSPATSLQQLFRVQNYDDIVYTIKCFPSCIFTVTSVTTATVTWRNWLKYQGDFSGDRVRKFRNVKRTKKRGEEKRKEEINIKENIKEKFGKYGKVKLTKTEYQELIIKFGQQGTKERIENLELYIGSKGDKYKSHYMTILSWEKKHEKEEKVRPETNYEMIDRVCQEGEWEK